jgi:hypothetical protein
MNEDYFDLDADLPHLLVVACINEADPTRLHVQTNSAAIENSWLRDVCRNLGTLDTLVAVEEKLGQFAKETGHPATPVNPVPALLISGAAQLPSNTPSSPTAKGTDSIRAAQAALLKAGCDPGPADGKDGPLTDHAATCFQEKNKTLLQVTKRLDAPTLKMLTLPKP